MSDVPVRRMPRGPVELAAGLTQLRVWGLGSGAAATADEIAALAARAGFVNVRTRQEGERVIAPALRFVRDRLDSGAGPLAMRLAARAMLAQVDALWRNGVLDYLLLRAERPAY